MSGFSALDYQSVLNAMRGALETKNEPDLKAIMSNNLNVILAALEIAADQETT